MSKIGSWHDLIQPPYSSSETRRRPSVSNFLQVSPQFSWEDVWYTSPVSMWESTRAMSQLSLDIHIIDVVDWSDLSNDNKANNYLGWYKSKKANELSMVYWVF